jgi:hypothetical protein
LAIVVAAPFERALVKLPGGLTLTTVEAVVISAVVALLVRAPSPRASDAAVTRLWQPAALFLLVLFAAAWFAPAERGNALRFAGRMCVAAMLVLLCIRVITTYRFARTIAVAVVGVATVVAGIAVLEAAHTPWVLDALTVFRPGFHVVAGQLRATSTLPYPTIASMYLEVAFAMGLWLLLDFTAHAGGWSRDGAPPGRRMLLAATAFTALLVIAAGITATFTRAGLLAMSATMLVMAVAHAGTPTAPAALRTILVLGGAVAGIVFVSHAPTALATRWTTEGSHAWYGATYDVPATLDLNTGALHRVPISVTNTGRLTWDSTREPAIAVSYHWVRAGSGEVVQFEGVRTPLPTAARSGDRIWLAADVVAPGEPGAYTLVWDLVHEHRAWFSTEGVAPARTHASVTGARVSAVHTRMKQLPRASVTPARPALWGAALQIASDYPLLGVGPDNYRHTYGRYLGLGEWDHRVHANNMYLELLAGTGLVGLAVFGYLLWQVGVGVWRRFHAAPDDRRNAAGAALAVCVVILGHGLVDSFLSFTSTYITFAVAIGLALSPGLLAARADHAHRV